MSGAMFAVGKPSRTPRWFPEITRPREVVGPAEEGRGETNLAGEEGFPDFRAADDGIADAKGVHHLDLEAQPAAGFGQEGLVPLPAPAEGVVVADEDPPDPQPLPEDLPDELLRRRPGVFEGKGDQDEGVDPEAGEEADLLLQGGDQVEGAPLGVEDHLRVGIEADRHGRAPLTVRLFDEPPENETVAEMDPVEIADGHEGALQAFGDVFTAADHVHHKSLLSSMGPIP